MKKHEPMWDFSQRRQVLANGVVLFTMIAGLQACATGAPKVRYADHSFFFTIENDSPGIELLAYRYANQSDDRSDKKTGETKQGYNTSGVMIVGDFLYAKWRIKATNEVFEDSIDLRSHLSIDMDEKILQFTIHEKQLYVFLADRKKYRSKETPIVGPFRTQAYVTKQLYPNN